MSLQGMLETIPLPDVLALLSATRKSGELRVTGGGGEGRLWLRDGAVVGADVARAATPVDAVFELLRLTSGNFAFESGAAAPRPGEPVAVDVLVAEAQQRLGEWRAIEAVVPSMACTVALAPELRSESVTISRRQWKHLVAVATAGDVSGVARRLSVGEYDACRSVKDLAEAGLIAVGAAPATAPRPAPAPARAAEEEPETPPLPSRPSARPAADADSNARPPAAPPRPAPERTAPERPAAAERPAPVRPAAASERPAERPAAERPAPERPAPVRPTAERTPAAAASARPTSAPARAAATASPSTPAGRRGSPVPSAEEADELVQQLASLGRGDAPAPAPAPATTERAANRTAPTPGRPAHAARGRTEPAARPAAEEAPTDADSTPPADAASDEPINRGMLLKFLSSVRP